MSVDATTSPVEVSVLSFVELFGASSRPLAVDTYQPGICLERREDSPARRRLGGLPAESDPKPHYYMGAVLVHHHAERGKRFIIDGQQRLTALCVLHQQLRGQLPVHCALTYSPKSARRIRAAAGLFREYSGVRTPKSLGRSSSR